MNRSRVSLFATSLVATLLCAGGSASADLLVTRDGATIETVGSWKVEGRQVLFTLPNGTLSSIRTDEVDLDASALATARAAEAAAAAATAPAPAAITAPILTLSEDDIPKADSEEGGEAKQPETEASPAGPLVVQSWEQMKMANEDGVQLFGVVKNTSKNTLTSVTVTAILYGDEGGMLANGDAQLNQTTIAPGGTANFRVEFPGLPDFASVKFDTAARGFETRPEAQGGQGGDTGAEAGGTAEGDANSTARSEASARADYEANMKATGNEPPPEPEPPPSEPPPEEAAPEEPPPGAR